MHKVLLAVFLFLAAAPAMAAPPPLLTEEERQVVAVFEKARGALQQKRGAAVVPLLSQETVRTLETVHAAARNGDRVTIGRLEPGAKFAAMGLRRHLTPAELGRMNLGDVADHAVRQGWLGPNIIAQSALGQVRVRGDRASALLLVNNRPATVPADFVRERGGWRIDLTNVFTFGGQMLRGFAAMSGKGEDEYIADILDRMQPGKTEAGRLPLAPSGEGSAPRAARGGDKIMRETLPPPGAR